MTTETQHHIYIIRKACIAANGSIEGETTCLRCGEKYGYPLGCTDEHGRKYRQHKQVKSCSKIGIADVLLAISDAVPKKQIGEIWIYDKVAHFGPQEKSSEFEWIWNLLDDDLTHQDPPTLAWLAELLG